MSEDIVEEAKQEEQLIFATEDFYNEIAKDYMARLLDAEANGNYEMIVQFFLHNRFVEGESPTGEKATFGLVSVGPTMAVYVDIERFSKLLTDSIQGTEFKLYMDSSINMTDSAGEKQDGKLVVIYNASKNKRMIDYINPPKKEEDAPKE